jgi:endonuclease-3 related protein
LHALAGWWLRDDDREQESSVAWDRPVETLRGELRDLPGVSLTLADRLLLLVGGMPAFPIDRPTIRIAGRHGWVDSNSDYDEWQTFFTRSANDCNASLAELHFWFGETGRDFCGIRPRCDQCPLRSLLPPSGALPLSEDESD